MRHINDVYDYKLYVIDFQKRAIKELQKYFKEHNPHPHFLKAIQIIKKLKA